MDLYHIKKRIFEKAKFIVSGEHTFTPRLTMRIYGISVSCSLRREEIVEISNKSGLDLTHYLTNILVTEFMSDTKSLNKFIQIENREKNLNTLLDENSDLGLYSQ